MSGTEQRFWSKVEKSSGCWIWTASKRNKGYGAFGYTLDGKVVHDRAHRYSYTIHFGDIPSGLMVLHHCDNPACVNPEHLFLGNAQENVNDMIAKNRRVSGGTYSQENYRRGTSHHKARLTEDIVREIRKCRDGGETFGEIAKRYGLYVGHVHKIVHRKLWSHVL